MTISLVLDDDEPIGIIMRAGRRCCARQDWGIWFTTRPKPATIRTAHLPEHMTEARAGRPTRLRVLARSFVANPVAGSSRFLPVRGPNLQMSWDAHDQRPLGQRNPTNDLEAARAAAFWTSPPCAGIQAAVVGNCRIAWCRSRQAKLLPRAPQSGGLDGGAEEVHAAVETARVSDSARALPGSI